MVISSKHSGLRVASGALRPEPLSRRYRRARARGAAVFIVVLVLAMLTAIGVFAASSASLSTTSAGHARVATQAQYLADLGVQATMARLEELGGWNVIDAAQQVAAASGQQAQCTGNPPECWAFRRKNIEDLLGGPMLDAPAAPNPGSLGHANVDWDFRVELSDKQAITVAGNSATPDQKVTIQFCRVAVNARAVIWPETTGNEDDAIAAAGSQASLSGTVQMLCSTN